MDWQLFLLFIAPTLLTIAYAVAEQMGVIDRVFGRKAALEGLRRLKSASGFPASWIYSDSEDRKVFDALEKRISKRTTEVKIRKALASGVKPTCITIGGAPIVLNGLPDTWQPGQSRVYTSAHPVVYLFGVERSGGMGKGERACTLGELEAWLSSEKDARKFCLGAVVVGIVSVGLVALRLASTG